MIPAHVVLPTLHFLPPWLTQFMAKNAFFTGGVGLGVLGSLGYALRSIPAKIGSFLEHQFIVEVDIQNSDVLFDWVRLWFNAHPYTGKSRFLSATTMYADELPSKKWGYHTLDSDLREDSPEDETPQWARKLNVVLSPAPGTHFMIYKKKLLWVTRKRTEPTGPPVGCNTDTGRLFPLPESFRVRMIGRNQAVIRSLLQEIIAPAHTPGIPVVSIYMPQYGTNWECVSRRPPRQLDSVLLDGHETRIRDDLNTFYKTKDWYRHMGIPWRRGYLLYGVPGSGKSSLAFALAGNLGLDIYIINLSNKKLEDHELIALIARIPKRSVLLLEDIDAAFNGREKVNSADGLTFSGLLNALDGVASKDGLVTFLSTNHIDKLDSALIRPGRCDMKLEFRNATHSQLRQLFLRFFPGKESEADVFVSGIRNESISMAQAQEYLIARKNSIDDAVRDTVDLKPPLTPIEDLM